MPAPNKKSRLDVAVKKVAYSKATGGNVTNDHTKGQEATAITSDTAFSLWFKGAEEVYAGYILSTNILPSFCHII